MRLTTRGPQIDSFFPNPLEPDRDDQYAWASWRDATLEDEAWSFVYGPVSDLAQVSSEVAQGLWSEAGAKDTAHSFSDITTLEGATGFWLGGRAAGNTADNGNDAMLVHIDSDGLLLSHHNYGAGPVDTGGIAMARLGDGVGISAHLFTAAAGYYGSTLIRTDIAGDICE